jgi:hypothetical protein
MRFLRYLDTPGGHILVLVFLIALGLIAISLEIQRAENILIGALAALWPLLSRNSKKYKPDGNGALQCDVKSPTGSSKNRKRRATQ